MDEEYGKSKGKEYDTKVIIGSLQEQILKISNGRVYMTGKRYFTIEKFLNKFFNGKTYIGVISTKIGFCLIVPKKENIPKDIDHRVAIPLSKPRY